MNGGNYAFLPEVANEEASAEMMMEVDEGYHRKQAYQFHRRSTYHPELYCDRDPCCGDFGVEVHGHAGQAKDSVATGGLFHHQLFCRPLFALLPLFGS